MHALYITNSTDLLKTNNFYFFSVQRILNEIKKIIILCNVNSSATTDLYLKHKKDNLLLSFTIVSANEDVFIIWKEDHGMT